MNDNDPIILEDESNPISRLGSGIECFLGYINKGDNPERALVFVREAWGQQHIYAVRESNAYQFVEDRALVDWAKLVVRAMGLSETTDNFYRIADQLQKTLDELVKMPPARIQSFIERTERMMREAGIRSISMNGKVVAD